MYPVRPVAAAKMSKSSVSFTPPPIEQMAYLSVECLYNHLRFYSFPSVSDKEKKALFLQCAHVPLKRPDIFNAIVAASKTEDYEALQKIVAENKATPSADSSVTKILQFAEKSWPLIMDCYFAEPEPGIAVDLLTILLFFPIVDEEMKGLKGFITKFQKMSVAERVSRVRKPLYAVTI